jgi:ubiquinone biosynthesis protein
MPVDVPIRSTIRNLRRATEIVSVLIKFGFGDFVRATGLDQLFARSKRLFSLSRKKARPVRHLPYPVRIRKVLEELGPTFIKLGQVLSTRPDIVPPELVAELKHLQDDCPQLSFESIRETLEHSFGDRFDDLFASFDEEPIAAASLGQTHRAILQDGTPVVVKVKRPGLRRLLQTDMEVLDALAHWVENHFENIGFSPVEVVQEFSNQLMQEIDYKREGQSADRLRQLFQRDPQIDFPFVYWDATTSDVLTLEEVQGTLVSKMRFENLEREERIRLVKLGARAVFRQCFEFGFFHADPHPGNLFVRPDKSICFIDCGMVGHLDQQTSNYLASIFYGVIVGETDMVIRAVTELTEADPVVTQSREFHVDVSAFITQFQHMPLGRIDMGKVLQDFFDKLRKYQIRCPSDIVFLIKAITTIEGIARSLAPEFNIFEYARPYVERLLRRRYSLAAIKKRLRKGMLSYTEFFEHFPRNADRLFDQLNRNRFQVHLQHEGLEKIDYSLLRSSRRISNAMNSAALIIGSSILILAESLTGEGNGWLFWLGVIGLIGSGAIGVFTVLFERPAQ